MYILQPVIIQRNHLGIDGYLEKYDISWDQYRIMPTEYRIYMPVLSEDTGLSGEEGVCSVKMNLQKTVIG